MFPLKDDNPTRITPIITGILIAVNVMVFLYQVSLGPQSLRLFVYQYGTIPSVVVGAQKLRENIAAIPSVLSIFTSMFLHGDWMHLLGNMWFLWIFGNNIEEAMGGLRYLLFYLASGFLASWSHILSNTNSILPSIGASGAIAGVLGAYILLYPRARVWTLIFLGFFIRLMYIPAGIILGYWFLLQILNGSMAGRQDAGGVAFWAHIGGFMSGMLLVGIFKKRGVRFFSPTLTTGPQILKKTGSGSTVSH
jgi:membrane associated rhomboid family serine protease